METKTIPTAEEFFHDKSKELNSDHEDMPEWMIEASKEFAKMHVKNALYRSLSLSAEISKSLEDIK
jgi:hypothetical protein